MPRDGAIIFSDLIGKLDLIRVACDKCGRDGCYGLNRLIECRGRDASAGNQVCRNFNVEHFRGFAVQAAVLTGCWAC
jgi:hypothetical protein